MITTFRKLLEYCLIDSKIGPEILHPSTIVKFTNVGPKSKKRKWMNVPVDKSMTWEEASSYLDIEFDSLITYSKEHPRVFIYTPSHIFFSDTCDYADDTFVCMNTVKRNP